MTSLDEKQENPRDQGKAQGKYYLPLFAHDLSLDAWMAFGDVVAPHFCADEADQRQFLTGWQTAWEDRDLLLEILGDEDQVIAECTRLADRRKLVVERQLFHRARLCITDPPPAHQGIYATTYDYATPQEALDAMVSWNPEESPEPSGWTRHHDTGRYRINGDVALEWVKDHHSMNREHNVGYAVRVAQGMHRVILKVEENNEHLGSEMPAGTRHFLVTSQDATDERRDSVYHCADRSVVIGHDEMQRVMLGNIIRRLKGGKD